MSLHEQILKKERRKYYRKGWLAFREVNYKNFIFDLFAFHPETKEIEIVEVDITNNSSEEKLSCARSIGKLRLIKPEYGRFSPKSINSFPLAISNPIRIRILELLCGENHRYSDLCSKLGMNARKDAGRFGYHIRLLLNAKLIWTENSKYMITGKGIKVIDFLKDF